MKTTKSTEQQHLFSEFGDVLAFLLDRESLPQQWLADNIPADKADVSRYVNNKRVPEKDRIRRIATLFGGHIQKKPTGKWAFLQNKNVDSALTLLDELDDRTSAGGTEQPNSDTAIEILERAVQLIRKCQNRIADEDRKG